MNKNVDMQQTVSELHTIENWWDTYVRKKAEYENLETAKEEAEQEVTKKWAESGRDFDVKQRGKLPARPTRPAGWAKTIPNSICVDWKHPTFSIVMTAILGLLSTFLGFLGVIAVSFLGVYLGFIIGLIPVVGEPVGLALVYFFGMLIFAVLMLGMANIYGINKDKKDKSFSVCRGLSDIRKDRAEWESQFNAGITDEALEQFYKEFRNYDDAFLAYVEACDKKVDEIIEDYAKEKAETSLKYIEKMEAKLAEITPILDDISNQSLLHSDYVPYAGRIANLIECGRADTLKEAINLMLDDIRKDNEEEARREEARRQEEENYRHNAAMQRIAEQEARDARAHNRAMEQAAKDQADAARAQADAARTQAAATQAMMKDARNQAQQAEKERRQREHSAYEAAFRLCQGCANASKCSGSVKNKNPNCAGYRPR